jgi:hypothetical protein
MAHQVPLNASDLHKRAFAGGSCELDDVDDITTPSRLYLLHRVASPLPHPTLWLCG